MRSILLFSMLLGFFFSCAGQGESELYHFMLQRSTKGDIQLMKPKFLSGFNPGGYTNQPAFTPQGHLLVSVRGKNDLQNDIWLLNVSSGRLRRLTNTSAYEYSPQIHPDEERLSFLQKTGDTPLHQQVCTVPLKGGEKEVVTPDFEDVGYYTWLSDHELGLFRIDESGYRLSYYDATERKSRRITSPIGRTLLTDGEGNLIYLHKYAEDVWYIKKYHPKTSAIDIIIQAKGKNEDFALGKDGTYFIIDGHILYYFQPSRDKEWKILADLSAYGILRGDRMAISPNGKEMVIVASREAP